jgi:hypothetical protein
MVTVEQLVFVDPNVTLAVDLAKRVKVELPNKRLESVVAKVLRQSFGLQPLEVRADDKCISRRSPLWD